MAAACGSTTSTNDALDGEVVLLLDAEPSWSYLYLKTILLAAADLRAVAVGLVGCGRSDKPAHRDDSTYQAHINWTWAAIEEIGLDAITVVDPNRDGPARPAPGRRAPRPLRRRGRRQHLPPAGDRPPSDAFMAWQRYCQDSPELRYGRIVHGGRVTDPPPDVPAERQHQKVIAAYRLQFTVPADQKDLHLEVFHNDLSPTPPMEAGTFSSPPRW